MKLLVSAPKHNAGSLPDTNTHKTPPVRSKPLQREKEAHVQALASIERKKYIFYSKNQTRTFSLSNARPPIGEMTSIKKFLGSRFLNYSFIFLKSLPV
jgi:hypothetical protein